LRKHLNVFATPTKSSRPIDAFERIETAHPNATHPKCRGTSMPRNRRNDGPFDLDALLDPARAFAHPSDVVNDPDLTLREKRAILSGWATRACAAQPTPALLRPADATPVHYDDVVDALRALDRRSALFRPRPHYRHVLENRIPGVFGRDSRDDERDHPLH
jgi:hypothetical protein